MQHFDLDPEAIFLCCFDIFSLFTNMPLRETIQISGDTLSNNEFVLPTIPKAIFTEILTAATT